MKTGRLFATRWRMSEPFPVPLPVLTTHRADRRDRGYLAWVAVANEVAHLHLDSAPIDAIPHALEIYVSGVDEPLVVIAEPMGQPTDEGFPLRLRPLDAAHEEVLRFELFGGPPPSAPPTVREDPKRFAFMTPATAFELPPTASSTIPPPLTQRHALALERMTGAGPSTTLSRRAPGALTGRALGDGRFELERLLGGGASGEVYRATHTTLRRAVAVKVLHPQLQQSQDYCARFYGEALAASRLDHRNVLRVLDYGQEPDATLYIVMELLEGESLQAIVDESGPLPLARIVHLVAQACAGLAHAHEAGVVHRDMKPENIVVVKRRDDEGNETELVKVCDFGIAHWTPLGTAQGGHTDTAIDRPDASQIVGTPVYMAPEQIRNETVDARTDVYALGVVLYELATGRVPFDSDDPMEILVQHLHDAPRPPSQIAPEIDRGLEAIILKALAKDPAQRFRSARELRMELRALADDGSSEGSGLHRRLSLRSQLTASDFLSSPAEALAKLRAMDDRTRSIGFTALGEAVKTAFVGGNARTGRELVAWIDARLADATLREGEREDAERARRALRDPAVVHAIVAHLIEAKPDGRDELLALLRDAGPIAASALVELRRSRMASLELRSRFVSTMRALGSGVLPAIVSALEPLAPLATRQDEALAEDLLRAIPEVPSDAAGDVAVRFVRFDKASLGMAALRAVSFSWGVRARPLLVGVLDANADAFRLLAIEALVRLGGMDDGALERLARILVGQSPAGDDVKLAAAAAFASALPECRPRAVWFLQQRLTPQQGFMSSLRKAIGPREDVRVLAALARSFAHLDPENARAFLEQLAAAQPELRPYVEAILAGRA